MSKKNKTPLAIFTESIGLYFSNFDKFVSYMTFPVLGQVFGLGLIFFLTEIYVKNMPAILSKFPALNSANLLISVLIFLLLPGMAILLRAFWEYLLAYGAVNSMFENMISSGKVYDFDAHTELIKRRTPAFVLLWFLIGIFSIIAVIPFFWVPCGVLAVFFVLIFQVFTFEPELSPVACAKKSLQLVKGHFASTFLLISLVGALTYIFIPQLVNLFCENIYITKAFMNILKPLVSELPISEWNNFLSYLYLSPLKLDDITKVVATSFIAQIFIQYTLPLRSILFAMWYKELNGGKLHIVEKTKNSKSRTKKPSEKLMIESNKKFTSKKLDTNILRRAMEKKDDN